MSKYFEPIDIRAEREANAPKPIVTDPDLIPDVTPAFAAIDQIMAEVQLGTSTLRDGAIRFTENKASPVKETLTRLKKLPTSKKTLREFILAAQGDLGRRVAQAMADHVKFADPTIMEVFNEPR